MTIYIFNIYTILYYYKTKKSKEFFGGTMNKKALIAMSGGVDSSVAAFLMKEQGYECIGATMKLYQNDDIVINKEHTCCSLDDVP